MSDFITVKASKEDGKVVIWESNPEHPEGEIFISGDGKTYQVARTAQVEKRLKEGTLVEVSKVQEFLTNVTTVVPPAQPKLKSEASKG